MKNKLLLITLLFAAIVVWAKTETAIIKSSMVCGMCEDNIRNGLIFEKGIKKVTFNLEVNEIYVKYNCKQTTVEEIEQKIALLGYDANEVKADEAAFKALDPCCQSKDKCEDMKNHHEHHEGDGHEH